MPIKLTAEILAAAIEGFEAQKARLDVRIAEIRRMLNDGRTARAAVPESPARRRKFSAAARKRMAAAQRKRWAEAKRQAEPPRPAAQEAAKPKRKISAAGRKKMIEATKKRWAAFRAAKRAEQVTAAKRAAAKKVGGKEMATKTSPLKVAKKAGKAPKTAEAAS